ncbi:hypothetical protein PBRA_000565, partial [Plasmodiophora brassicae]
LRPTPHQDEAHDRHRRSGEVRRTAYRGRRLGTRMASPRCPLHKAMAAVQLAVKRLTPSAVLPSRGSAFAAGYDLSSSEACVVPAHGKALVPTGLSIALPAGVYGRIAPRSGLAWKHHIDGRSRVAVTVSFGAGVVDRDYRGPVGVVLFNHSSSDFKIEAGDRIAQLILERIVNDADVVEMDDLPDSERGSQGFGSTGVKRQKPVEEADDEERA